LEILSHFGKADIIPKIEQTQKVNQAIENERHIHRYSQALVMHSASEAKLDIREMYSDVISNLAWDVENHPASPPDEVQVTSLCEKESEVAEDNDCSVFFWSQDEICTYDRCT
jgi:hypothetical protein